MSLEANYSPKIFPWVVLGWSTRKKFKRHRCLYFIETLLTKTFKFVWLHQMKITKPCPRFSRKNFKITSLIQLGQNSIFCQSHLFLGQNFFSSDQKVIYLTRDLLWIGQFGALLDRQLDTDVEKKYLFLSFVVSSEMKRRRNKLPHSKWVFLSGK